MQLSSLAAPELAPDVFEETCHTDSLHARDGAQLCYGLAVSVSFSAPTDCLDARDGPHQHTLTANYADLKLNEHHDGVMSCLEAKFDKANAQKK